ncbi:MAG: hypothetical protein R3C68_10730 [Myxococcota bacterium]
MCYLPVSVLGAVWPILVWSPPRGLSVPPIRIVLRMGACNLALEPESDRGRCLESAGTDHEAPGLEGPGVSPASRAFGYRGGEVQ